MSIEKEPAFEKLGVDCDARNPAAAFDKLISKAGGISELAHSIGASRSEINRWKKQGAIPMSRALIVSILYQVPCKDLVSDEDAMWLSLMQLERSFGELQVALEKTLKQTTALIDSMFTPQTKIAAKEEKFVEKGA